jgi:thiosulfate/3-mercaptopyruvate sulfurtransferase
MAMSSSLIDNVDTVLLNKVQIPVTTAIQCHGHSNVKFLDGSWWLGARATTNRQDFELGPRIAGAHFFDIDQVGSPPGSPTNPKNLPHMMPTPQTFAAVMDAMGIQNTDHLIVYGQNACPFVFRAYFQLACMGHDYARVHMLQGSLQDWILAGGTTDEAPTQAMCVADLDVSQPPSYTAARQPRNVVDMQDVLEITKQYVERQSADDDALLVDVRSPDRFYGRVEEPRAGLRLGHMPGAKNLFFFQLLDPDEPTKLKPRDELMTVLQETLGPDVLSNKRVIATCGSGATACVLAAALLECVVAPEKVSIYDGSWCEWGSDPNTPIVQEDEA